MFEHIVVGTDGSDQAHDAIVLGAAIAKATGGELTLLRAVSTTDGDGQTTGDSRLGEAERELQAERDRRAPEAHAECIAGDDVVEALRLQVERRNADLVVIGSSRPSAMGRGAVGETGRRLLRQTPAAIAVAARGICAQPAQIRTIAVGFEGGRESGRALEMAEALALATGADLTIETIYELPVEAPALAGSRASGPADELRAGARRAAVVTAERVLAETSVQCHLNMRVGEPASELRKASAGVDLMVIGSGRERAAAREVSGPASRALMADCGCSLIVATQSEPLRSSAFHAHGGCARTVSAEGPCRACSRDRV